MGTKPIVSTLSSALFSRVQSRVLGVLFGQPDRQLQLAEIIARAASGRGAVQRELEKLTRAGIVSTAAYGKRKLYHANRQSPVFNEVHQLVLKTTGVVEPLREALMAFRPSIRSAFVYGSVASGKDTAESDIDLMIVGDNLSYSEVYASLQKAEDILARPINPNLVSVGDWSRKIKDKRSFATRISNQPRLFVIGNDHDLAAPG